MYKPNVILSDSQITQYKEQGFLQLPQLSNSGELELILDIYDRIFSSQAGRDTGNYLDLGGVDAEGSEPAMPQILDMIALAPELEHTQLRANTLAIGKQLYGEGGNIKGDMAILKPARTAPETPWHQDEAYWEVDKKHRACSTWVPLLDVTLEMGCMYYLPGSHKLGILPHQRMNNDPRIHALQIVVGCTDLSTAVACPIKAGEAIVHDQRTLHYAGPNLSDLPRRAYISGYRFSSVDRVAGEERDFAWADTERSRFTDTIEKLK
ncbi:MAG: phytanoyl-CoA dioxygenase family protein [Rhodospirillales bacterium]|nr:phytanoyl-CoA dioxygenase family protein [Rhodospirillales bacterium]